MRMRPDPDETLVTLESLSQHGVGERAAWGLGEIAKAVGLAVVIYFFVAVAIILPTDAAFDSDSAGTVLGQIAAVALLDAGLVLAAFRLARGKGAGWRELGLRPASETKATGWTLRRLITLVIVANFVARGLIVIYGLLLELLGLEDLLPAQQLDDEFFEHDFVLPLLGVALVIIAPFAEEVFFRGFVFAGLRRRLAFLPAALVSGILFSFAHGDPGLVVPFALVGMVLAYAYERTGTLLAPMGVHLVFNLVSFLALVFIPEWR